MTRAWGSVWPGKEWVDPWLCAGLEYMHLLGPWNTWVCLGWDLHRSVLPLLKVMTLLLLAIEIADMSQSLLCARLCVLAPLIFIIT